jgi:hypothetical protein
MALLRTDGSLRLLAEVFGKVAGELPEADEGMFHVRFTGPDRGAFVHDVFRIWVDACVKPEDVPEGENPLDYVKEHVSAGCRFSSADPVFWDLGDYEAVYAEVLRRASGMMEKLNEAYREGLRVSLYAPDTYPDEDFYSLGEKK